VGWIYALPKSCTGLTEVGVAADGWLVAQKMAEIVPVDIDVGSGRHVLRR
jgi:hypothetical protein